MDKVRSSYPHFPGKKRYVIIDVRGGKEVETAYSFDDLTSAMSKKRELGGGFEVAVGETTPIKPTEPPPSVATDEYPDLDPEETETIIRNFRPGKNKGES